MEDSKVRKVIPIRYQHMQGYVGAEEMLSDHAQKGLDKLLSGIRDDDEWDQHKRKA